MTFGEKVTQYYFKLRPDFRLPSGTGLLNPFVETDTRKVFADFNRKFYGDHSPRIFVFGINPGRFGAGVTGISFTDPVRLENNCGIPNSFQKKAELSSLFIYDVIAAYGGVEKFYRNFYVTALCPLGFVKDGKNLNYYDDKKLAAAVSGFIRDSVKRQTSFGMRGSTCICLGEGKNYEYFSRMNEDTKVFDEIIPLPHPRWIMQYRRKTAGDFVARYVNVLKSTVEKAG